MRRNPLQTRNFSASDGAQREGKISAASIRKGRNTGDIGRATALRKSRLKIKIEIINEPLRIVIPFPKRIEC